MDSLSDRDGLISSFCEMTATSPQQAREYLESSGWSVETAVAAYFADQEEASAEQTSHGSSSAPPAEPEYTGPRTLDGRPAPQAATSSAAKSRKPPKKKGLATLSSLGGDHNESDDDDDDADDDDIDPRGPRDLFAGGEKSGLAVQDPAMAPSGSKKLIKDIVAKARENASRNDISPVTPRPSSGPGFRGTGMTLGGDGVESREIPDPHGAPIPAVGAASNTSDTAPQERTLHLWSDGFSIDEGPLRRFDDPQHAVDLQMIRQGRAPLHLMNVRYDQPVDVKLVQHPEEWRQLPKVYRPFSGEGHRLGSPVPGEETMPSVPMVTSTSGTSQPSSGAAPTNADESQPTITIRIQLPDGTRLPARFNTTQSIGDIYDFVARASPDTRTRQWVLATTFPNKNHVDKDLVLGDLAEFKKGGTAVVKWV